MLLLVGGANCVAVVVGWVVCATFFVVCSFSRFLWGLEKVCSVVCLNFEFALYFRVRFLCGTVFCVVAIIQLG